MGDSVEPRYNEGEQQYMHDEGARRLVVDAEEDRTLNPNTGDGHQPVAQPPAGTIGGPAAGAGGDRTDQAHTVPAGGGPGDPREMEPRGDTPTQNVHGGEDSGAGASPDAAG